MKTAMLVVVLVAGVSHAEPTAFDRIAVALKERVTFQPDACTLTVPTGKADVTVPLRTVTWSLSTSDGVALATARCPARRSCITGISQAHTTDIPHEPAGKQVTTLARLSLTLAVTGKDARRVFADLKGLAAQCTR